VLGDSANPEDANMNISAAKISIIAATAMALLAGCAAPLELDIAVDTDGTPTVPVEAVTEEPVVDIATLSSGDQLTKQQALDINRDFTTGVRGYQMADESWVAILKESPLPEAVKAEIAVEVLAVAEVARAGDTVSLTASVGAAQYATSKRLLAVVPVQSSCGQWVPAYFGWGITSGKQFITSCMSKDEAIAHAQALIAEKPDSANWDLIIG
jgi:type IV pilus biogenesis protein CpaD/CtpE